MGGGELDLGLVANHRDATLVALRAQLFGGAQTSHGGPYDDDLR